MYKAFTFFLVAFLACESMAMSFKVKRQSGNGNTMAAQAAAAIPRQVQPVPTNASATGNGQTTVSQQEMQACIRGCPVTAEYNPVCGSNSVTYSNPGRLICAQACGVSVNLLRTSPCPTS